MTISKHARNHNVLFKRGCRLQWYLYYIDGQSMRYRFDDGFLNVRSDSRLDACMWSWIFIALQWVSAVHTPGKKYSRDELTHRGKHRLGSKCRKLNFDEWRLPFHKISLHHRRGGYIYIYIFSVFTPCPNPKFDVSIVRASSLKHPLAWLCGERRLVDTTSFGSSLVMLIFQSMALTSQTWCSPNVITLPWYGYASTTTLLGDLYICDHHLHNISSTHLPSSHATLHPLLLPL